MNPLRSSAARLGALVAIVGIALAAGTGHVLSLRAGRAQDAKVVQANVVATRRAMNMYFAEQAAALAAEAQAIALAERADSLEGAARSSQRAAASAKAAYRELAAAAPAECAPVVAAADSALAAEELVSVQLDSALQSSQEASKTLRTSLDSLTMVSGLLAASAGDLAASSEVLAQPFRASLKSRLAAVLPRPTVGAMVGVGPGGKVATVAGVGFGWSF